MTSLITVTNLLLLAAGVLVGLAAGYLGFPAIREAKRLRIELDRVLQEHEKYKTSVNSHFRKTAELVGDMTRSYAAVYDHLASGARSFCEDAGAETKLPFEPLPAALASPVIETAAMEMGDPAWAPEVAIDLHGAHSAEEAVLDASVDEVLGANASDSAATADAGGPPPRVD